MSQSEKLTKMISYWIIVFFTFTSYPFGFRSFLPLTINTLFFIQGFLLIVLIILSSKQLIFVFKKERYIRFLFCFLLFYSTIRWIGGGRCFNSYLEQIMLITFFGVSAITIHKSEFIYSKILNLWKFVGILVSVSVILSFIIFIFSPSFFYVREVGSYTMFYNLLLGFIYAERLRPCWFFLEPSYCGNFLALFFLLNLKINYRYKKIRNAILITTLIAIMIDASVGAILGMLIVLFIMFFSKKINERKLVFVVYSLLVVLLIGMLNFDYNQFADKYLTDTKTSFISRQNRMQNTNSYLSKMSFGEILVGAGVDAMAYEFEVGESNGYYKLLCEYGLVYTVLFLGSIIYMTRRNLLTQSFFLFSLVSLIIFHTPIVLLTLFLSSFYRQNNYMTSKYM